MSDEFTPPLFFRFHPPSGHHRDRVRAHLLILNPMAEAVYPDRFFSLVPLSAHMSCSGLVAGCVDEMICCCDRDDIQPHLRGGCRWTLFLMRDSAFLTFQYRCTSGMRVYAVNCRIRLKHSRDAGKCIGVWMENSKARKRLCAC